MNVQYDKIAADYSRAKQTPLRRHVEAWSFERMIGAVTGLRVLDLACGDGFYSRRLAAAGAAEVVGVDISAAMIALAEAAERQEPLGIRYFCADVADLADDSEYDLVTAAYLLHYAPNTETLARMCRQVAKRLRPGGRFVAINENPELLVGGSGCYAQYGFDKSMEPAATDGSRIEYAMISGRSLMRITAYYYTRATYERLLHAAGFREIIWRPLQVSPEGIAEQGQDYWQDSLERPPVIGLECLL